MKIKMLMLVLLVLFNGVVISTPMGKGCIIKYVFYDDVPFEGAYVELCPGVGKVACCHGYTGPDGSVSFCEKEYGTYYLYVDWDNDGVWDTEAEPVVLDQDSVEVYNYYYPPEVGCGDTIFIEYLA